MYSTETRIEGCWDLISVGVQHRHLSEDHSAGDEVTTNSPWPAAHALVALVDDAVLELQTPLNCFKANFDLAAGRFWGTCGEHHGH